MGIFSAGNLFRASVILYLCGAAVSLAFIKRHKTCNIIANSICIAASVLLAAASVIKILSGNSPINLFVLKSTIPFLSIDMKIDNLSAIFLLSLSILVVCVSIYSIGYLSHYIGKRNVGLFCFLYSAFILSMDICTDIGKRCFFLYFMGINVVTLLLSGDFRVGAGRKPEGRNVIHYYDAYRCRLFAGRIYDHLQLYKIL